MNQNTLSQAELVLETLAFYGMGGQFSTDGAGGCCYLQPETGRMCAVGRCLNPASLPSEYNNSAQLDELNLDYVEDFLPPYQGHEVAFWGDLQRVHDTAALEYFRVPLYVSIDEVLRSINARSDLELPLDNIKFKLLYPAFFYSIR